MCDGPVLAPIYLQLREAITRVVPGEHGLAPSADLPHLWGALVDVGLPPGPVTLVAIADSTTSLYLGDGGATVGVGGLPSVSAASRELLRLLDAALPRFAATWDYPVPPPGGVQFLALTYAGMAVVRTSMDALEQPAHPLGPAWRQAGAVVELIERLDRARITDRRRPTA